LKIKWYVYIVQCGDSTLYTGVTTDLTRRIAEHNGVGKKGAKAVRGKRPVSFFYSEEYPSRSAAQKREAAIKKMSHADKVHLHK